MKCKNCGQKVNTLKDKFKNAHNIGETVEFHTYVKIAKDHFLDLLETAHDNYDGQDDYGSYMIKYVEREG